VIVDLFKITLTSTYFLFDGQYYEQTDGVAMGSPLSPAVANFFMESFEQKALESAPLKPSCFYRYVDDTFVIWPHGRNALQSFLEFLNNQHSNIKFTMETETEGCIPFLDILIRRKPDGSLGHSVYRKPTHTDLYLNGNSFHHKSQRNTVISTLALRAKTISDQESLPSELAHLKKTLLQNGYKKDDIRLVLKRTFSSKKKTTPETEDPVNIAVLPYTGKLSGKLARILRRHNIKTIHRPPSKIRNLLRPVKDDLGLKTPGVYCIPCECGKTYIGQTGRTVEHRCKEHERYIKLFYPEKSGLAEHSITEKHRILFSDTKIISKSSNYWDRIIKESLAILQERNNDNRDTVFQLSRTWTPVIKKTYMKTTNQRQAIGQPIRDTDS
jgi:predicted GIY-YIG superfamily endonuclease